MELIHSGIDGEPNDMWKKLINRCRWLKLGAVGIRSLHLTEVQWSIVTLLFLSQWAVGWTFQVDYELY